ncbi:hypothetical protein COCON_G00181470 [Conger conger]|uniref:Guanylate cyclase activator 2B n=1 Tax=Conger conger TaxID=82655 RepID=A0A9Q1HRF4_CONCO|nr:guanylin-like [Conger conger]KAJ8259135.1 hypothetical protein COCON_G00181470 [Conger conger]
MKPSLSIVVLLVAFAFVTEAIQVEEGDFSFPLESVIKLKELMGLDDTVKRSPRLATTSTTAVCTNPDLPTEFLSLCQTKGAASSFFRLGFLAARPDLCEICAYAACTGCL